MKIDLVLSECKNRNTKKFLKYIIQELDQMGVSLYLDANLSQVGAKTAGYYCNNEKTIRCYINLCNSFWLGVLSHEYSHAKQAQEGTKEWRDFEELELTMEDIQIKRKLPPTLHRFRRVIIALEWDAEYRAIKLIKKFKLDLNLDKYIQEANLLFFKYIFLTHKHIWPELKKVHQDTLIDQMPTVLISQSELSWSKMSPLLKSQLEELRIK